MPVYLKDFKFGWQALGNALNDIVDANNSNVPVEGAGIRIEESKNGCIISRSDMSGGVQQQEPPLKKGWYHFTWAGINWKALTVVDPSDCSQSTVNVLVKVPNDPGITVALFFDPTGRTDSTDADQTNAIKIQ